MLDTIFGRIAKSIGQNSETFAQGFLDSVPLGRFQEPQDIAAAVHFLVSADAAQITGQSLVVDGGFMLTH